MVNLNVGNKWNNEFLDAIIKLNKKYKDTRITELFGNPAGQPYGGVRPEDRLPRLCGVDMVDFISKCEDNGIIINYTLNNVDMTRVILDRFELLNLQYFVSNMICFGIKRFTVYSPFVIKYIDWGNANVEISTIHNNYDFNYLNGFASLNKQVDKICLPIYMNRAPNAIVSFINSSPYKTAETIVNEFCVSISNTCNYRGECYFIQSCNKNIAYPFNLCTNYRKNGVGWLKAPFILPEWLDYYHDLGIDTFKLTGRTHPTESILKVLEKYMNKDSGDISLEELWGIGLPGQELVNDYRIPVKSILDIGFLKTLQLKPDCITEICGDSCNYCEKVFSQIGVRKC